MEKALENLISVICSKIYLSLLPAFYPNPTISPPNCMYIFPDKMKLSSIVDTIADPLVWITALDLERHMITDIHLTASKCCTLSSLRGKRAV